MSDRASTPTSVGVGGGHSTSGIDEPAIRVTKRDGSYARYDVHKIEVALLKAFHEVQPADIPDVGMLADMVEDEVIEKVGGNGRHVSVEYLQDLVEQILMETGHLEVAKAYILYREERRRVREQRLRPDSNAVGDYIHAAKYAKWLKDDQRRETYEETVARNRAMHLDYYKKEIEANPQLQKLIDDAYELVLKKRILPSMRSFQFGGDAMFRNHERGFNCAFTHMNRLRAFQEIFHMLLSGCGVGFSVQYEHVTRLPEVKQIDAHRVRHYTIPDTIEGWADALGELIKAHFVTGEYVEFDYSKIRDEGKSLSSGGKAPGHLPLKHALEIIRTHLSSRAGRKLRPIEVFDILCWTAEAVLAGGIRRSSLWSGFSIDDSEMLHAKAHENFRPAFDNDPGKNNQRQMANISAVCIRDVTTREQFDRILRLSREWGEPGFYWTRSTAYGCNPCGEIGLHPVLMELLNQQDTTLNYDWQKYAKLRTQHVYAKGIAARVRHTNSFIDSDATAVGAYGHNTGVQFCNLAETNCAKCDTPEEFLAAVRSAAVLCTLQAGYTYFPYLGPVTERITQREALIGVGLTGMADSPEIAFDPELQRQAAELVAETNREVAAIIGINAAARCCTIKPSGTASLELGCVGSGIHDHHARRYFRRVTANPLEPVAQHFAALNPHMVEEKPSGDLSLIFPTEAPAGAITTKETPALDFIERVLSTFENWIVPGTTGDEVSPSLTHNVSCTVPVSENEWDEVIEKVWNERDRIAAMAFLARTGDKTWPFAPREEVTTPADEAKWNNLIELYRPVNYTELVETEDATQRNQEPACAGGTCET